MCARKACLVCVPGEHAQCVPEEHAQCGCLESMLSFTPYKTGWGCWRFAIACNAGLSSRGNE